MADEVHPWATDPENPDASLTDPSTTSWVTLDVERWYTTDWGTTFSAWMPAGAPPVGARVAVAGDAYHTVVSDFSGQSGAADVCELAPMNGKLIAQAPTGQTPTSETPISETPALWDVRFGGSVQAGASAPAGRPLMPT